MRGGDGVCNSKKSLNNKLGVLLVQNERLALARL